MDFTIPDLSPPASGSPADMGVRTARINGSFGSTGGRKSFSTVLQGAREDKGRTEVRNVDDGRSTNKADHKTRSTETREQSSSSVAGERTDEPTSHAGGTEENRSSDAAGGDTTGSRADSASPTESSRGGSNVQGGTSESLSPVISPQAVAQAITQTDVRTEGEDLPTTETTDSLAPHSPEPRSHPLIGFLTTRMDSLRTTNSPKTVPASSEAPVLPDDGGSARHDVPLQAPDAPAILAKTRTTPEPIGKPGFAVPGEASKPEMTNRLQMHPALPDSPLRSTLSPRDAMVPGPAPIQVEAGVPGGKPEGAGEGASFDRIVSPEVSKAEQPLREHQETGGRTFPVAPYGQGSTPDRDERFTGSFEDHNGHQNGQPEIKIPQQMATVNLPRSGEQAAESIMAGAHGPMVSNPPPPPPASSPHSGWQVSPAVPMQDHAEKFAQVMPRSVVFNVTQPDIGQVNIRVAMTSDVVHTHLSTDRPEVGQFFINGQDRLQAAFQASGLDMGQFRVDIDRQGAGRSFYQGSSPEQGQTWNHGAQRQGTQWEQGPDRQDDQRAALYGLLNVVA